MTVASTKTRRTPAQVAADGFAALIEKLGVADATRFVQLYDPGHGDYTKDRQNWLGTVSIGNIADLVDEIEREKNGN